MTSNDSETFDPADIAAHAHWTRDVVRYADTDRQGHVNNAVFAVFLESGRVSILYDPEQPLAPAGASFVIARLVLDFRTEMRWPNEVWIGTTVKRLGRSSVTLSQGVFVDGTCTATAETVIVLMDEETRKSRSFPEATRARLAGLLARENGVMDT
jgi:acyl-CoA thioester hydrolase